jgi:hypothetical protein
MMKLCCRFTCNFCLVLSDKTLNLQEGLCSEFVVYRRHLSVSVCRPLITKPFQSVKDRSFFSIGIPVFRSHPSQKLTMILSEQAPFTT